MKRVNLSQFAAVVVAVGVILGGCTVEEKPDVVTTPGSTTVVHDRTPAPDVNIVTPPASSSTTETHSTTVVPSEGDSSSTTSTTTTKSGG